MVMATTRPLVASLAPTLRRTVVHHARPPRVPIISGPHVEHAPRKTEGTNTARPQALATESDIPASSFTTPSSSKLEGDLTFHHAPPPTAPSYTTGAKPALLRWIDGEGVAVTGEEHAPLRRAELPRGVGLPFSEEQVGQITQLRAAGRSRGEILKKLKLPKEQKHLISRVARSSPERLAIEANRVEEQQANWPNKKATARAVRERRKDFW